MTLQGNDWLALTEEPTLEPEIPICDPHHHFWEYRPEPLAYQRYLLQELVGPNLLPTNAIFYKNWPTTSTAVTMFVPPCSLR